MSRFDCNIKICIITSLDDVTLAVVLYIFYTFYEEIRMNSNVLSFVNARVAFQMPSEICHNLQTSGLHQMENVMQHQVYYHWQEKK